MFGYNLTLWNSKFWRIKKLLYSYWFWFSLKITKNKNNTILKIQTLQVILNFCSEMRQQDTVDCAIPWPRWTELIFCSVLRVRMKHRFECRCQFCQFNSDVKNPKLCNILTYKGFIQTQRWIHPVPADAVWIKQQHVYVLVLHSQGKCIASLICLPVFVFGHLFLLCYVNMMISLVWVGVEKRQHFWGKYLGSWELVTL